MGMFIQVTVDNAALEKSDGIASQIVEVCPVKIFALGTKKGTIDVVEDNVDECTLCDLCTKASPEGVKVKKLYED